MALERCHAFSFLFFDRNRIIYCTNTLSLFDTYKHTFTFAPMISTKIKPNRRSNVCVKLMTFISRSFIDFLSSSNGSVWVANQTCVVQCYRPPSLSHLLLIEESLFAHALGRIRGFSSFFLFFHSGDDRNRKAPPHRFSLIKINRNDKSTIALLQTRVVLSQTWHRNWIQCSFWMKSTYTFICYVLS